MTSPLPIEHIYDLADLSNAGAEVTVTAKPDRLKALAQWLDVDSVENFKGVVTLSRLAQGRFRYEAVLTCDLTRGSVVTLEPLKVHIKETFSREIHVVRRARAAQKDVEVTIGSGDDDGPEEIASHKYDLAGPLLEELSLALDPYPRAPDEVFAPPSVPGDQPESPFAILKTLKKGG